MSLIFESFSTFNRHGGRRSRHPPSPMTVTSSALDPKRHCYVVTKDLCASRPKEFAKGEVFRHFQGRNPICGSETSEARFGWRWLEQTAQLLVCRIVFWALRWVTLTMRVSWRWICAAKFSPVVNALNGIKLDSHLSRIFCGKGFTVNPNAQSASEIELE